MHKLFKKCLICLLTASTMLGTVACTPKPPFDTETPPVDTTEQPTEAVTDPPIPEVDRTKPQTGPFSSTTELSFEKQNAELIDKVLTEEYEFISVAESSEIFSIGDGRAKGNVITLPSDTVASVGMGVQFNENTLAKYQFKITASDPEADYDAAYFGLRLTGMGAGSYNAFAGGKQVRLDASSTKAVLMGRGNEFYLPKAFVETVIGVSCEGLTTYDHYGITYVMPAEAIAAAGKAITVADDGLVVISSAAVEDKNVLTTLYRALM
jgi:hypothetical protein